MEREGLWETSTVIVTSDHWWRAIHRGDWGLNEEEQAVFGDGPDRRVPVLIKLPGQRRETRYEHPFNTVLLHDLVLEIFADRIVSPRDVGAWLDANRSPRQIPYLAGESG